MSDSETTALAMPTLHVMTGADVLARIDADRPACLDLVARAYLTHAAGDSNNPHSAFLRLPQRPNARIISLPAYLGGSFDVAGIKWISSFPDNNARGIPRASAVLVLNDTETGYPMVCMESSVVSATRTAASAVLAGETLLGGRVARRVGIIGTGLIAGHVWKFLRDLAWQIDGIRLFDAKAEHAERFAADVVAGGGPDVEVVTDVAGAIEGCDLVIFTTIASEPHVHDPELFAHNPVVLHLSLRDLAPAIILSAQNVTDDIDHAVRERTSLHLTEQQVGNRDFVTTTIADMMNGDVARDPNRPAVFSPFGLGILDLAVGQWVYQLAQKESGTLAVEEFYGSAVR